MNEVTIPLKLTGVGSMKAELRSLKAEIANATDPAQMEALAKKAGELSDKIKDANDAVNVFASGSKFEQISNSFDGIKSSLMSLDFEEASEKSKVFASNLGKIGKADISKALKGITGMVKNVGGAFVKLGVQILANPIFLLAAVITAIVTAIVVFLNKIGVLQKVLNTLMIPINLLIDGFKKLTDWIGLTTYAQEENAVRMQKANEKAVESSKKRSEKISDAYDIEIAKAKANGKDVTDLEIAKSKALSKESQGRLNDAENEYRYLLKRASKDNFERRKKLREQIEAEKKILSDGRKERTLLQIEDDKEQEDKAKEQAKTRIENAKAYSKNRLDAERTIKDIEIALIDDENAREIATINEKYKRLAEDAKKNENLTGAERVKIMKLYEEQRINDLETLAKKEEDVKKADAKRIEDGIKANQDLQLQKEEDFQEQMRQLRMTDQQRELDEVQTKYFELIALAEQYGMDTNALIEKQKAEEKVINDKYAEAETQKRLDSIEKAKNERDAKIQFANDIATGIGAIGEMFIKDQKKLEQFNKAQALIQIGIDTAKAISSLTAMSQANPLNAVTGGAAGIAQYASGIVQIITNIAKAKALLSNPNGSASVGGGGTGSSSESSTSVTQATPAVQLFGQGNNYNTQGQLKSSSSPQNMVVTAVVSESDITSTQSKLFKLQKNAEL